MGIRRRIIAVVTLVLAIGGDLNRGHLANLDRSPGPCTGHGRCRPSGPRGPRGVRECDCAHGRVVAVLCFFPAASGRSGVAFGVVTTGEVTTATVRVRRHDFDAPAAAGLLNLLCEAVLTGREARR